MSIWQHPQIKSKFPNTQHLTLTEGNTPLEWIEIDGYKLGLKREDQNPSGSFKDRGSALKISQLATAKAHEAVIASSGNAAISMMRYAELTGLTMLIAVSPNMAEEKHKQIKKLAFEADHEVIETKRAKTMAARLAGRKGIPNLKASLDQDLPIAYQSIAFELADQKPTDVFVPTSSGTAYTGIAQGFLELGLAVRVHAVQPTSVSTIAKLMMGEKSSQETDHRSKADAIVDKSALRKWQVQELAQKTGGSGWVITEQELEEAYHRANEQVTKKISYTSALSIAACLKHLHSETNAQTRTRTRTGTRTKTKTKSHTTIPPICIISGN